MNAGQLRHRIVLQRLAKGQDDWGEPAADWQDIMPVWANVKFMSGSETIRTGAAESQTTQASVRIRPRNVDPAWRVLYKGVSYDIKAVLPADDHVDLVVEAVR